MHYYLQIVVLLIGTNNVQNSATEVAEGIVEIVKTIRNKLPEAYIVLPVRYIYFQIFSSISLIIINIC